MFALLLACATPPAADTAADTGDTATDTGDTATDTGDDFDPPAVELVTITTADGVELVGDYYGHREGAEAVLLLHMIPPTYDRTSWPLEFIEALRDDGYAVLALDRRGAGDSAGVATEAYTGPNGRLDADAAVELLSDRGATSLVLVAASNGTTTALDYAVGGAGLPPRAMVWMSPGTYTENNTDLGALDLDALLMMYPKNEAAWPEAARSEFDPDGRWDSVEYSGTAHGTMLFDTDHDVSGDLRAWLGPAR